MMAAVADKCTSTTFNQEDDVEASLWRRRRRPTPDDDDDDKCNRNSNNNNDDEVDDDEVAVAVEEDVSPLLASELNVDNNNSNYVDDLDNIEDDNGNNDELPDDDDDDEQQLEEQQQSTNIISFYDHRYWIAGLTIGFESFTCILRFGFHLESTKDTSQLAKFTFGLRIHHGYIGILLLLFSATIWSRRRSRRRSRCLQCVMPPQHVRIWCFRIGWSLILSDLIHHFLVLWPITGSPHFDIFYPSA